ncbi:Dicarboxylate transport [Marinobacter sp. es.048]|uniref:YdbH domain-containing protein n=1 Tax=Marinobacter sp. es.048 TaxID=1761795 RepID=UPI000B64E770|nr:YdbH domain-containing protein [Marinobacter sp. es.048]SNC75940.1 Dicarboxylate transport [Marinobacter sp. es.048]
MPSKGCVKPERIGRGLLWAGGLTLVAWPLAVAGWSFAIEQSSLGMALPDIRSGGWEVTGSQADIRPSVTANSDSATIEFAPSSLVLTDHLAFIGADQPLTLNNLRTDLSNTTVTLDYGATGPWAQRISIDGDIRIDAARVEHPQLLPQTWNFQGRAKGRLADLRVQGTLASESGLTADLDIQLNPEGGVSVAIDSVIDGKQGVRALAEALAGWPDLLTVDSGNARLSMEVSTDQGGELAASGSVELQDVGGVFNRTAVSGLTGLVRGSLENSQIAASFRDMTVGEINAGIPVSSVLFSGNYNAPVMEMLAGTLEVQQARARFLEGTLRVPPAVYELGPGSGRIPVEVEDVSLSRLMAVYPAEGLSGSGLLRGRVPLGITGDGVQVSAGSISAIDPGGRLQLPADKLQAMLGGNQAMDIVVQALQNFHYSVLNSTIDYDEQGKLSLGLRLEGKNPDLRGGQPVVLNVNLEEDIPALLTSLQLSGRVNEAVTRRVRKLLQESGEEKAP